VSAYIDLERIPLLHNYQMCRLRLLESIYIHEMESKDTLRLYAAVPCPSDWEIRIDWYPIGTMVLARNAPVQIWHVIGKPRLNDSVNNRTDD